MPKQAKGWLRRKNYAEGEVWLYCFYTCRPTDKKRVENYEIIGLVRDFHSEAEAWQEASRLGYWKLLDPSISLSRTFGEIAQHWRKEELTKTGAIGKRAAETISTHESMLDGFILPRWAAVKALKMQPVDIESWFEELAITPNMRYYPEGQHAPNGKPEKPLNWGSIQKIKSTMSLVFSHALRNKLIPVALESNPFRDSKELGGVRCKASTEYEATVVSPEQMIIILHCLDTPLTQMEWMMAVLHATTAVRPEEGFALKWKDIDWENGQINLCRAWSKGKLTEGKNEDSMVPVAMHPVLANFLLEWRKQSPYPEEEDWVFPSIKLKGAKPRTASIAAQDYLRPAAVFAGVIEEGSSKRFGWHNLRHSLAEFLAGEVDPAVTMKTLRHKKIATTMERYTHRITSKQQAAQGLYLTAIGKMPKQKKGKKG